MKKKLIIIAGVLVAVFGGLILLKESSLGTQIVWEASQGGKWLLPLVAISALLDSINPCAFSVLVITLTFLFGLGFSRGRILAIGGVYIFGIFLVYLMIGLGLLRTLDIFGVPNFMGKLGAFLMIVFGVLVSIQEIFPKIHIPLGIPHSAREKMGKLIHKASVPTAFILGTLVAICEFPCTGGPYLMILGLLHDGATYAKGFAYLVFYNLLFVSPLLLILGAAADKDAVAVAEKIRKGEFKKARLIVGLIMVALGVLVFVLY